jgi:hypothetical protein
MSRKEKFWMIVTLAIAMAAILAFCGWFAGVMSYVLVGMVVIGQGQQMPPELAEAFSLSNHATALILMWVGSVLLSIPLVWFEIGVMYPPPPPPPYSE